VRCEFVERTVWERGGAVSYVCIKALQAFKTALRERDRTTQLLQQMESVCNCRETLEPYHSCISLHRNPHPHNHAPPSQSILTPYSPHSYPPK
jgi:hypothetical protein